MVLWNFQGYVIKNTDSFTSFSVGLITQGKARHSSSPMYGSTCIKIDVVFQQLARNWELQPTAMWVSCFGNRSSHQWSLQVTGNLANRLTAASRETQSQNDQTKLLPNSWHRSQGVINAHCFESLLKLCTLIQPNFILLTEKVSCNTHKWNWTVIVPKIRLQNNAYNMIQLLLKNVKLSICLYIFFESKERAKWFTVV